MPSSIPIVAAPMAGGPSTPALAAAVAEAGGFPFLAAGYKTPEAMASEIQQLARTHVPFGVNLFVPSDSHLDRAHYQAYAAKLEPDAARFGVTLPSEPIADDDHWDAKIAILLADPVPVVSFVFGLPDPDVVARLHQAGSQVLCTVTTVPEALSAQDTGCDGLIVQGTAAGGHSATLDPARELTPVDTAVLVAEVRDAVKLPLIGAGGIDGPEAVARIVQAGAQAAGVGTLLLRTDESGAAPLYKDALADASFTETVITLAFAGRPARALRNDFIDNHGASAPRGYPEIHHLTAPLRRAAAKAADLHALNLWAGTGYRKASTGPVGRVIADLVSLV